MAHAFSSGQLGPQAAYDQAQLGVEVPVRVVRPQGEPLGEIREALRVDDLGQSLRPDAPGLGRGYGCRGAVREMVRSGEAVDRSPTPGLLRDTKESLPMEPGSVQRRDYEYERGGVYLLVFCEPLEGIADLAGSGRGIRIFRSGRNVRGKREARIAGVGEAGARVARGAESQE